MFENFYRELKVTNNKSDLRTINIKILSNIIFQNNSLKMQVFNVVFTRYAHAQEIGKPNNVKVLGSM